MTDPLKIASEDISTLTSGPITVQNRLVVPPQAPGDCATTLDLRPANNLLLAISAHLDVATATASWSFQSLDPVTHQPPEDPSAGFLPPGGEGSVFFTVMSKRGLATNSQITNQASVVSDANVPINTPTWMNTFDNTPPTSKGSSLAATQASATFAVGWTGSDVGSGMQDFTIYVSDNGGPFAAWQGRTSDTSATFTGQAGHLYGFYSIARDAT